MQQPLNFDRSYGLPSLSPCAGFRSLQFRSSFAATLAVIGTAIVWMAFAISAVHFFNDFPTHYSWTELMLNYQGGFVRRGLLGELAFRADGLIPAKISLLSMVTAVTLLTTAYLIAEICRRPSFAAVLFLASPAALLFPIYDYAAFGRKDIMVLGALAATLAIARSKASNATAFAAAITIYLICSFIVEFSFFYFPFAFIAFVIVRRHELQTGPVVNAAVAACICAASFFILTAISNGSSDVDAMVRSWQAIYPNAYTPNRGAATFLDLNLSQGLEMVGHAYRSAVTLTSYLLAMLFANMPLFIVLKEPQPRLRFHWTHCAMATGLIPFALAADWGRYIYLFSAHLFVVASVLRNEAGDGDRPPASIGIPAQIGILAVYALTWRLIHFAYNSSSAIAPGVLFTLLPR